MFGQISEYSLLISNHFSLPGSVSAFMASTGHSGSQTQALPPSTSSLLPKTQALPPSTSSLLPQTQALPPSTSSLLPQTPSPQNPALTSLSLPQTHATF